MKIGVVGLGTVGYGVVEILTNEKNRLEKAINEEIVIKYGCGLEEVDLPDGIIYTKDFNDVINDNIVDFVTMLNNNIKRIEEIKKLEYNWNDNEAEPIDKTICDNVLNIIYEVIIQPKIFPTANDSIQLEYYDKNDRNKYLEFEVFKDYINVYEILSDSKEKSYIINSISTNKINSIIMDFYEINRK